MHKNAIKWVFVIGLSWSLHGPLQAAPVQSGSTPVEREDQKIELEFRPRVGEERVLRMNVVQQGTQVGGKRKSTLRQMVGIDTVYRVLSAATDGRVRVRATTRAVRFVQEIDGKVTSRYDSSKPARPVGNQAETLAMLQGLSFVLQLNPNGTIEQIEEKDKIVEQMLDKMKIPQAERELLRPLLLGSLDGSAFKNIGNVFASFADEEVSIGDSWPKTDVVATDSNLIYAGRLTLAKRENGLSTLHLQSATKPDPKRASDARVLPMTGTQKGYYLVEEKTGWTRRAHIEQRWNARVSDMGSPVPAGVKSARRLYVKMTFDVGTLSAK